MADPIVFNDSVRMVTVQFSFSNLDIVPYRVRDVDAETLVDSLARKGRKNGYPVLEPVERVSSRSFVRELMAAGWELVDAFRQCRVNQKTGQSYWIVRYNFVRKEHVDLLAQFNWFKENRSAILEELQKLIDQAFWRVRIWNNPFFQKREEVEGQRALSVNFEVRVPLSDRNGTPILARLEDEQGRKVGKPVPLQPAAELHVIRKEIQLIPYA